AGNFVDDAKSLFIEEFTAIAEGKLIFQSETRHIAVSGEKKHLLLKWSVQPGYEDTYEKVIVSIVDISERKHAENALLRERTAFGIMANAAVYSESMNELCERLLVGIVETLDFDIGTLRLVNKAGDSLRLVASTGIEQENCIQDVSLVGGAGSDLFAAEVARSKSVIFATDANKDPVVSKNLSRIRELGIESIIFWPLLDAQGELIGVLNIATMTRKDFTEQDRDFFKTLADILTAAIERMLAKDEMQMAWARAELFNDLMAHDLNNVHQGLLTTLELLLIDDSFPEKYRERAESALSQVQRSLDLIGNVRKFSQVDQADDLKLELTDLYKVVQEAIDAVQQTFQHKKLKPNLGIRADEYHVMVDEFFVDVLYNLFHNAMKFDVNETVELDISARKSDCAQFLDISITDKGPGISDEQKQKLFSRLELKKSGGSGIGLTLVKRIIDRYNGDVFVRDRSGDKSKPGACFIVRLPFTK
ncbi:MAG: ATP-binding protein, partial [Candidatus Thorarchaeota archaeon]